MMSEYDVLVARIERQPGVVGAMLVGQKDGSPFAKRRVELLVGLANQAALAKLAGTTVTNELTTLTTQGDYQLPRTYRVSVGVRF